jgi:hypothetical protein
MQMLWLFRVAAASGVSSSFELRNYDVKHNKETDIIHERVIRTHL